MNTVEKTYMFGNQRNIYTQHMLNIVAITFALFFSACGSNGGDDSAGNNGGGGIHVSLDVGQCNSANPCPDSQFCWNGLCALGCTNNSNCATDQYCDTFMMYCVNKEVTTCPAVACAASQECVKGLCVAAEQPVVPACTPNVSNDGCNADAFCMAGETENDSNVCQSFPSCDQYGECPTGLYGAVCNNGYYPNKAHVCLAGLCERSTDCPSSWSCFRFNTSDVLGACSDGSLGMPCSTGSDCTSGQCSSDIFGSGFGGDFGGGGIPGAGSHLPGVCL